MYILITMKEFMSNMLLKYHHVLSGYDISGT